MRQEDILRTADDHAARPPGRNEASLWLSKIGVVSLIASAASLLAGVPREAKAAFPPTTEPPRVPGEDLRLRRADQRTARALLMRQSRFKLHGDLSEKKQSGPTAVPDDCPGTIIPAGSYPAATPYVVSGDTTGANNTVWNYAGGWYYYDVSGPDHIYTFTITAVGPNPKIDVLANAQTYDPAIYILNGLTRKGCWSGETSRAWAIAASDWISPGSTEFLSSATVRNLPKNVPLHLFIDASGYSPTANRSGPYTVRFQDVTIGPTVIPPANDAPLDFDGDGKTDPVVVRNTGGGAGGQLTWFTRNSGDQQTSTQQWGVEGDRFVPGDYDGDGRDDIAVWRPGAQGRFYVIGSRSQTIHVIDFGQTGDDPTVVADYTGDGIDDLAVYRAGAAAGAQSYWFYRSLDEVSGPFTVIPFGQHGDRPVPGYYRDWFPMVMIAVQRPEGQFGRFFIRYPFEPFETFLFGLSNDILVPGDYDGDGTTDIAVARVEGGNLAWYFRPSESFGPAQPWRRSLWGVSTTDIITQGDYDGDGATDFSIWRPGATASFYQKSPLTGGIDVIQWGQAGDAPPAGYNSR